MFYNTGCNNLLQIFLLRQHTFILSTYKFDTGTIFIVCARCLHLNHTIFFYRSLRAHEAVGNLDKIQKKFFSVCKKHDTNIWISRHQLTIHFLNRRET